MVFQEIKIKRAKENNLKDLSIDIPHDQLVVISGISGSGKSSLAFNTIYSEAQRRYMETLSAYARQFIGNFDRPDVEHIEGLRPTISIDQKSVSKNPRSTVGTLTEIFDYLRVLFARVGEPHCPHCGAKVSARPPEQIVQLIMANFEGEKIQILAPMFEKRKGEYRKELKEWKQSGYLRLRIDGKEVYLDEEDVKLERYVQHTIEIIVDRLVCNEKNENRINESVNQALSLARGKVKILGEKEEKEYSSKLVCINCGISVPTFAPRDFSFNSATGACPTCKGLGKIPQIDPKKFVCNPELSVLDGAIATMTATKKHFTYASLSVNGMRQIAEQLGIDIEKPFKDLPPEHQHMILYGVPDKELTIHWSWQSKSSDTRFSGENKIIWRGLIPATMRGYYRTKSEAMRKKLEKLMTLRTCPDCQGGRIKKESQAVKFRGKSITELNTMSVGECLKFFNSVKLSPEEEKICGGLVKEIRNRLSFLVEVGLHYLTLDRSAAELSGGESQRTRLATQIGSKLQGVTYILDEPSIGLANRDNEKLLNSLKTLRDNGNTVIVVEHDEDTLREADLLIDLGPGAGENGGQLLFAKAPFALDENDAKKSYTARYLLGKDEIPIPSSRRQSDKKLLLQGARHNNLKNIDVEFPLQTFICVTGVSGSGKSSLVTDTLYPALANRLNNSSLTEGDFDAIEGLEHIDKVIVINQTPIGRTPRSNPATYTKVMDHIRDLFASLPEAKIRGYTKTRFSFNTKEGQCPACKGYGYEIIQMSLLPDVEVECDICKGKRYDDETLKIKYKGRSIADVLNMTVTEALKLFENQPSIKRILQTLEDVGLGYIRLGQSSTTLSGGEAQRIKLSRELAKRATGKTLYILDEPTTGLSFEDIKKLLNVLQRLVDAGNTVVIIEHNLDVIKVADYIIDLGPEGGDKEGGYIVATGTPEEVAKNPKSYTGQALAQIFANEKKRKAAQEKSNSLSKRYNPKDYLYVEGASKHNLKHISLDIPKNKLVVITGPSGSGKSSLAMDTIFAEGQRRFVESLSSYARQFLNIAEQGEIENIVGLTPSIAISQHSLSRNPRSTVATTAELYDYLRLLYAKVSVPHCIHCGKELRRTTPSEFAKKLLEKPTSKITIGAPINGDVDRETIISNLRKEGFTRILVDDKIVRLDEIKTISPKAHLAVIIDRIPLKKENQTRITEAIELASNWGKGRIIVITDTEIEKHSLYPECLECNYQAPEDVHPRLFSFNHYSGACETCGGLGTLRKLDIRKIIVDPEKSIAEGGLGPYPASRFERHTWIKAVLTAVAHHFGFTLDTPIKDLTPEQLNGLFYGSNGQIVSYTYEEGGSRSKWKMERNEPWPGLIPRWEVALEESTNENWKNRMEQYFSEYTCPDCNGKRLQKKVLSFKIAGKSISDVTAMSVEAFVDFLANLKFSEKEQKIAQSILDELNKRAKYLMDVGLGYLTLDRRSHTLSNGEVQRIRLASQIGSGLVGVTYVLDEPTIGLHPRDIDRLLNSLKKLRDNGNHVIVVEHDSQIISAADWIVELGPAAGEYGGELVYSGPVNMLLNNGNVSSITAEYLSGKRKIATPPSRRKAKDFIEIEEAAENNLKKINVKIGKGVITAVTGVSGAGKSSLVIDVLLKALQKYIHKKKIAVGKHKKISGYSDLKKVVVVDQNPLSRSVRSNPATYLGVFDHIRKFYAQLPKAHISGLNPGHFSFNSPKGYCPDCKGLGKHKVELLFLADVWITCPTCKGKRYKKGILDVRYKQFSIADVLELTIDEAIKIFENNSNIVYPLKIASEVGLGYLRLGQSTTTLSGGEAERLKLAKELATQSQKNTIFILDEPSMGLHNVDLEKLITILHKLADNEATIIFIDHNMDLVKNADYVIDLGPEGGERGGYIVVEGEPEEIVKKENQGYTSFYLKQVLENGN